ncbi:hypothetical protein BDM02DRAFT_1282139 [Thelephora ganbajun]|uniref:Uncharacterized protein n=1 Tax=Thelephora ganbajun TaxID=370292 RepID=A0ACB6Z2W6_THEGA|nr:hypothetical protein BDM02DRAFT_1282139 [Thelephora ganbajun]
MLNIHRIFLVSLPPGNIGPKIPWKDFLTIIQGGICLFFRPFAVAKYPQDTWRFPHIFPGVFRSGKHPSAHCVYKLVDHFLHYGAHDFRMNPVRLP